MSLIEAQGLERRFGGETVLHGVNLSVERGEIVTIVGPNGSGKSTLLRMLAGALTPSSGTVTHAKGLVIGYVPQKLTLETGLPMSVRRFLDVPKRQSDADVIHALKRVSAETLSARQLEGLSGGQMQRVLLARALLQKPDVLMLDEPTQGLDQTGQADFYRMIEELRQELGCAVMMVSHELHVVMSASDRVICLNGHICCQGTPEIVQSAPEYRALFGTGTHGTLALYRHEHDHTHDHVHDENCAHGEDA
ncbi:metal ABC transporter ATP-binding protein [Lentibacter algarum]|uniref:metal ABC transporter ATP-binding protein n=1 Tax=Lentibacter algarum TaxID=576131 RepID=UPI001C06D46C|nr:metal ABC transporter ATP-binding protein [Lentibacter algarum]MBU2981593.1 metal ABC transporter ATP-binding protein [Lentibacter algarum]